MKAATWLVIFIADLTVELVAVWQHWEAVQWVAKPLIVIMLLARVLVVNKKKNVLWRFLITALFFSLLGDVSLLMDKQNPLFFMLGLGSFLLAHVAYIFFFLRVKKINLPRRKWSIPVTLCIVAYIAVLLVWLQGGLGDLRVPVLVYALALGGMLLAAIQAFDPKSGSPAIICIPGAVLFVISDSLLAIDKFLYPFAAAALVIMLTYGLAQLLLVQGATALQSSLDNH